MEGACRLNGQQTTATCTPTTTATKQRGGPEMG